MNLQIRLLRKPFTTILWVTLVTAMTVLLSIGGALWYSSDGVVGLIDDLHTSIAVRTDQNSWSVEQPGADYDVWVSENKNFTPEDVAAFEAMDCVEEVYFHTLSGAASPAFRPVYSIGADAESDKYYCDIMVVGEITALYHGQYTDQFTGETFYTAYATMKIEEYVLENHDFTDFMHWNYIKDTHMNISFSFPEQEMTNYLQTGQRYVCFGQYEPIPLPHEMDDGTEMESHPWIWVSDDTAVVDDCIRYIDYKDRTQEPAQPVYGAVAMKRIDGNLDDFLADPANTLVAEVIERWEKQQHSLAVLGTENLDAMYSFATHQAWIVDGRTFTAEEYDTGAKVCILSETMAAKAGIAVGDTITMEQFLCCNPAFLNHNRSIDSFDGRLNDPAIGHLKFSMEYAPAEEFTVVGLYRQTNDWADTSYSFTANTVFIPKRAQIDGAFGGPSENLTGMHYTVVDGNVTEMQTDPMAGTFGVYFSIKLKNGRITEFTELMAADDRFNGQFLTIDQGFGSIMEIIQGISDSTAKLVGILMLCWLALLMLYMLLYQGMQKRNLGIMRALGATPREAGGYLWLSGMAVAAAGVALGTLISVFVLDYVETLLFDAATYSVPLTQYSTGGQMSQTMLQEMLAQSQLSIPALLLMALAQIALFALVLRLQASSIAKKEPRYLINA